MTLFDYAVIGVILASTLLAILRGLVREILSLVFWVVALAVANHWADQVAVLMPAAISDERLRLIAAFLVLFIGALMIGSIISTLIGIVIRGSGLTVVDRGLGALFGLLRGVAIVLMVVTLGGLTRASQQPWWRDALLAAPCEQAVHTLKPYLPESWARYVRF